MPTKNQQRRAAILKKKKDHDMEFLDALIKKQQTPIEQKSIDQTNQVNTESKSPAKSPVKSLSKEQLNAARQIIIDKANDFWKVYKHYVNTHKEFKDLKDQDKLEIFRTKFKYAEFMDEFPIVSRYLVCHGQYAEKAFNKMLYKIEKTEHPPPDKREPGYMEDQWVRRQADYVKYLWGAYNTHHRNNAERNFFWQTTYNHLKKEFDDFRDMHKEIEKRVEKERKDLAGQNARELLERIKSGDQTLSEEEKIKLLNELKHIVDNKGKEPEQQDEPEKKKTEPKIQMIEIVEAERMHEIDDKYKPEELKGMRAIIE